MKRMDQQPRERLWLDVAGNALLWGAVLLVVLAVIATVGGPA